MRPATAATVRPGSAQYVNASASLRPQSAPVNRPQSGKRKGHLDINLAAHCARVRTIANQSKSSSADREAMTALLDGIDLLKTQKQDAVDGMQEASSQLSAIMIENEDMREQLMGLGHLIGEYKKLDIVAQMMSNPQLIESIGEINATIHRYNPTAQKSAASVPPDEDHDSSLSSSQSIPARSSSPSQMVMQANRVAQAGLTDMMADEVLNEGLTTHSLLQEKLRALERLVFILKKRVLVFESNQELVEMLDKYGSVQGMLDQMHVMEGENDKLRLRELGFQRDPLVRRRVCSQRNNMTVTPVVLLALQNELASAYAGMRIFTLSHTCTVYAHT